MTGLVGILFALVAGWFVVGRRRVALTVIVPFLAVLGVQTWYIASGKASSPPSTVQFPGAFGYYLVQLVMLGLALGAADQVRIRRSRKARAELRPSWVALATNLIIGAVVALAFLSADGVFDPGSRATHASSGPPAIGMLGVVASALCFIVLGIVNRRDRRADRVPVAA